MAQLLWHLPWNTIGVSIGGKCQFGARAAGRGPCVRARSPLLRIAEVYIDIALRQPVRFDLMMVRAYPWQDIQSRGMLDVTDAPNGEATRPRVSRLAEQARDVS